MKRTTYHLALFAALFSSASFSVPLCQNTNGNFDANGWGWENGASCVRPGSVAAGNLNPQCSSSVSDQDGDGWGWENGQSCRVSGQSQSSQTQSSNSTDHLATLPPEVAAAVSGVPACESNFSDFDGDGWGYQNGQSCLVGGLAAFVSTFYGDAGNAGSINNGLGDSGSANTASQSSAGTVPTGVIFRNNTLKRIGGSGDNWCQTWAADDSVVTAMDDGEWLNGGYVYHSRLYKIYGDADNFSRSEVTNYPNYHTDGDGWFAYGMLSVKGVLYSLVTKTQTGAWSHGPFRGMKMLRSYDAGNSWHRVDRNNNDRYLDRWDIAREELTHEEMFFFEEGGRNGYGRTAWPFAFASFVQRGQDHRASADGYVYIYSPEGAKANQLLLARVPEDQVGNRSAWQYFSGWNGNSPTWSSNLEARQPNMYLPERNNNGEYFGFYSWLPSVVWNPGLQKYIMVNGGTYGGGLSNSTDDYYAQWMHSRTGSLGFWYSDTPYGPWKQIYYTDYWTTDDPQNLNYQPKLSPKWISDDGRTMTLIWSDAMRNARGNSHSINYKWNQMEIEIQTR